MPLTFIAGIYGMNFDWMPELRVWWGYPLTLGAMLIVSVVIFIWFYRKRWI
jgi:magnesium transporter